MLKILYVKTYYRLMKEGRVSYVFVGFIAALVISLLIAGDSKAENETITVNHVVLVDTPPHPEWEWNYSYQVEVGDLQMDVNYTAVIFIGGYGDQPSGEEWGGVDWRWDDIETDGEQYEFTISLQRGCYYINADLYESGALNSDEENATVLAFDQLNFTIGNGTCVNGAYSESDDNNEQPANNQTANNQTANNQTANNETNGDSGYCPSEITDEEEIDDSCVATFDEPKTEAIDEKDENRLSSMSLVGSIVIITIIAFKRKYEN